MDVKITRKTNLIETLQKKIKDIQKASVSSGYYPESGIHEDSGMHYAALMSLHEFGSRIEAIPARPVREITINTAVRDGKYWCDDVRNYLEGKKTLNSSLNSIGSELTDTAQGIFGSSPPLTENAESTVEIKGKNTPLVDTGDLRNEWTWKVSLTSSDS